MTLYESNHSRGLETDFRAGRRFPGRFLLLLLFIDLDNQHNAPAAAASDYRYDYHSRDETAADLNWWSEQSTVPAAAAAGESTMLVDRLADSAEPHDLQ